MSAEANNRIEDYRGVVFVNVNGRKVGVSDQGQIVKGPAAIKGKWVAPSQFSQLKETKDYHGHLFLSDKEEDIPLAEAELELLAQNSSIQPEDVREGALFTYNGCEGRVEAVREDGTPIVNLSGAVRPMSAAILLREATFHPHPSGTTEVLSVTDEDIALLNEGSSEKKSEDDDDKDSLKILEAKSDVELLDEVQQRLDVLAKRKAG